MADSIDALAAALGGRLVFIRLREDLPIERDAAGKKIEFTLPAQTPLPLTPAGAQALREDDRVFPLPALVQGVLMLLEREEAVGKEYAPLPTYRVFARTMAADVVSAAESELDQALSERNWPLARARAVFLLNLSDFPFSKEHARLWAALGTAASRTGQLEKAAEWLSMASKLDEGLAEAAAELGTVCGRLGRYLDAKNALVRASRLLRGDFAVLFNLAQTCQMLGELDQARSFLREAEKLKPGDPEVQELKLRLGPPAPPRAG